MRKQLVGLFTAALMCLGTFSAQAQELLQIDLSVTNEITVTATAGLSAVTASGSDTTGIYLENFYGGAGSSLANVLVAGDFTNFLNPSDLSPSLFRGGVGADPGLNIWSFSSDTTVDFTAGLQAFTGSATWSLTAAEYADMLAGNQSGNIYFPADTEDDIAGGALLIGTYGPASVIPEPTSIALLGGFGLLALARRRR